MIDLEFPNFHPFLEFKILAKTINYLKSSLSLDWAWGQYLSWSSRELHGEYNKGSPCWVIYSWLTSSWIAPNFIHDSEPLRSLKYQKNEYKAIRTSGYLSLLTVSLRQRLILCISVKKYIFGKIILVPVRRWWTQRFHLSLLKVFRAIENISP